jgi:hypothetical protein
MESNIELHNHYEILVREDAKGSDRGIRSQLLLEGHRSCLLLVL